MADRDAKAEGAAVSVQKDRRRRRRWCRGRRYCSDLPDFPILIGIKLKFLFDLAHITGIRPWTIEKDCSSYVLSMTFSSSRRNRNCLTPLRIGLSSLKTCRSAADFMNQVNWLQLQQEYGSTIDFRKMLSLIPGIRAVVGAWANFGFA